MELIRFDFSDHKSLARVKAALETVRSVETEENILTNALGDVPWSLKNILVNKTRCTNGFFTAAFEEDLFVGVVGCDRTDLVFPNSIHFGIRLWVHPNFRTKRVPSALISPALQLAQDERRVAWTSFNDDRAGMLRLIKIRATDGDAEVSSLWQGFQHLPEQMSVHNTLQWVAFKDFR
jgi:GNAT superfamily N-acetyltransferase